MTKKTIISILSLTVANAGLGLLLSQVITHTLPTAVEMNTMNQAATLVRPKVSLGISHRIYEAGVERVVDGDTVDVVIHLGLDVYRAERLRLRGIDTPKIRGEERDEGLRSKAEVDRLLPRGTGVLLSTISDKRGKYGRLIALVFVNGTNLNEHLVNSGFAEEADY